MEIENLGALRARIGGDGQGPVLVLMHGFGAPGDDLVPFAAELSRGGRLPAGTRFVFPEAPLAFDLGFGDSRAWWMIDLERIQTALMTGSIEQLVRDEPQGLVEARQQLSSLLDAVEARFGVTGEQIILGGFSQGAMLACDVAFSTERALGGLVLLSGTLLAEDRWSAAMAKRKVLPVFQSHGLLDPLLPYFVAERLRDLLLRAGLAVDFVPFQGGHEIPRPVLDRLARWIGTSTSRP